LESEVIMAVDFEALDLIRTQNKAEQHERQKIKFLEDRIKTLEKAVERLNKMIGEQNAE
jgi:TolA-binding protein